MCTMGTLLEKLKNVETRTEARVVILAGQGSAFSAGHNLAELASECGAEQHRKLFAKCIELMEWIQQMKLPVIAEIEGIVAAAGCQLMASTDIVIASETSSFLCPGIKVGLFCSTPGIPLARNIPRKIAMDMLLTARALDANEALRAGLVSRVSPKGEAKAEALNVANEIIKFSKPVIAMGKAFFYTQIELNVHTANRQGAAVMCENLKLKDAQEGISAFLEKRKPQWSQTEQKA